MAFGKKKQKNNNKNLNKDKINDVNMQSPKETIGFADSKSSVKKKTIAGKKSLRNSVFAGLLVVGALLVLAFVVHHLYDYIAAKPEFSFITTGTVQHTIGAKALIVRDEVLVGSDSQGDLVTRSTEGSRVATGQTLAMVVPENMASVALDLRNTQSQISDIQQELIASGLGAEAKIIFDDVDEQIEPIIDRIRLDAMSGNISDMSSYESSISVLTDTRETLLSELEFNDERINVLRNDETVYENQLASSSSMVYAPNPGIVSFKIDGLESVLTFDTLINGSSDVISDYIDTSTGIITSDLYIDEDESAARISQNEMQYIAVILDDKTVSLNDFAVDSVHTINVDSEGVCIEHCVVERSEACDEGILIIFSTTRQVESLIDLRTVDIEIVITESTGLCASTISLVNPDHERGIATIYVNRNGFCEEMSVIIVDYDREFAIIEPMGDSSEPNRQTVIITNPSSVSPGEKVEN